MSTNSEFVKATGDCRIMLAKVREFIENKQNRGWLLEHTFKKVTTTHHHHKEFMTLEQVGKAMSGTKLCGYWTCGMVWDVYLMYQTMSMNGRQCYKSEIELEIPTMEQTFHCVPWMDPMMMLENPEQHKKIEAKLKRVYSSGRVQPKDLRFSNYEKMLTFFKPYRINQYHDVPIMKIVTKGFHDVKILINNSNQYYDDAPEEEETVVTNNRRETKKQKVLSNEEPCRLYFVVVDCPVYVYLEFLPYGRGIRLAEAIDLPWLSPDYKGLKKEDLMSLLKNTKDDVFYWSVKTLLY